MKRYKKIEVNTKVLNEWLDSNGKNYVQLAADTGMSSTQAFNLTRRSNSGSQTIAQLVGLKIPNLFQLVTYEVVNRKARITNKQNMIITIGKGAEA